MEAVLVGGGGGTNDSSTGAPYAGAGGEVLLHSFNTTNTIAFQVGAAGFTTTATQFTAIPTNTQAFGGGDGDAVAGTGGESGNLNAGANGALGAGGGGAGASPTSTFNGGAGVVVSSLATSGSLFSGDTACYGGGGAVSNIVATIRLYGVATCGGGYVQTGPTPTVVAPLANTGGGGGGYDHEASANPGAAGVAIVRWKLPVSTVTFDSNGHGAAVAAQDVITGTTAAQPTTPTASGYTFNGWYTDPALTTAADFTAPITANTTLYASWALAITSSPSVTATPTPTPTPTATPIATLTTTALPTTGVNAAPLAGLALIILALGGAVLLLVRRLRVRLR